MIMWFGSFNIIITTDKILAVLGKTMPVIATLLTMILRFIPKMTEHGKDTLEANQALNGVKRQDEGKTIKAKIETDKEMTIRMFEEVKAMDEVVVTGYFTKAKSSYTGAAKTVSGDELKTISSTNIVTALAALTPGLEIVERSEFGSNPNKVPELLLRGMGTFNNSNVQVNQPTIILDGKEI